MDGFHKVLQGKYWFMRLPSDMSNLDAFQLVIYLDLLYFVLIHPRSLTENGISNRKYHWNNIYIAFSMPMWIVGVYRAGVSYRQLRYIEWISKATTPKRKKANAMCVLLQTVCICTTANELPRDAKSSRKKRETSNDITPTRTHTQTHSHGTDTHLCLVYLAAQQFTRCSFFCVLPASADMDNIALHWREKKSIRNTQV